MRRRHPSLGRCRPPLRRRLRRLRRRDCLALRGDLFGLGAESLVESLVLLRGLLQRGGGVALGPEAVVLALAQGVAQLRALLAPPVLLLLVPQRRLQRRAAAEGGSG